jgi:hypothetical protein
MEHFTITSREFVHNVSAAKRLAVAGPVFITDRGRPAFTLLNIDEYRRLSNPVGQSVAELLCQPEATNISFDIEPISMGIRDLED